MKTIVSGETYDSLPDFGDFFVYLPCHMICFIKLNSIFSPLYHITFSNLLRMRQPLVSIGDL